MAESLTSDDLIAFEEIRRAMARYARGVDRKDFDLLRSAYHPDAYDNHGLYDGDVDGLIAWLESRHGSIVQCTHFLGNSLINRDGDAADVETYGVLMQHERLDRKTFADRAELFRRMILGVRYVDRFERRDGDWRIARHEVVYEWSKEEIAPLKFNPEMTVAQRSNEDAVFTLASL